MGIHTLIKASTAAAVALTMGLGAVTVEAKTLKLQASSKAGDWGCRQAQPPPAREIADPEQQFTLA